MLIWLHNQPRICRHDRTLSKDEKGWVHDVPALFYRGNMSNKDPDFVMYQGRRVDKNYFRVYVYGMDGQRLANTYNEYVALIDSGKWFSSKSDVPVVKQKRTKSYDADSERVR